MAITEIWTLDTARILNQRTNEWDTGFLTVYRRRKPIIIIPETTIAAGAVVTSDPIYTEPYGSLDYYGFGAGFDNNKIGWAEDHSANGTEWVGGGIYQVPTSPEAIISATINTIWVRIRIKNTDIVSRVAKVTGVLGT